MPDEPLFDGALQIEATAYAVHPEGAEVPAPIPADEPAPDKE